MKPDRLTILDSYSPTQLRILAVFRGRWPALLAGGFGALGWWCLAWDFWLYTPPVSDGVNHGLEFAVIFGVIILAIVAGLFGLWALCSYRPLGRMRSALLLIGLSYSLYVLVWLSTM